MAMTRLMGLEKRLTRDPDFQRMVNEQTNSFKQKQYLSKASQEEIGIMDNRRGIYQQL